MENFVKESTISGLITKQHSSTRLQIFFSNTSITRIPESISTKSLGVSIPKREPSPAEGITQINFDNLATVAPNIKSGKLIALAVTTPQRSSALPDVPAIAETLSGFAVDTWWGLVAPAQTPASVIQKLNQAFVQALQSPETKTRFATLMAEPVPTTADTFGIFMRSELAKYEVVVKRSGAKVD